MAGGAENPEVEVAEEGGLFLEEEEELNFGITKGFEVLAIEEMAKLKDASFCLTIADLTTS